MTNKLIVLGSINVDHILNLPAFPAPGETLTGQAYQVAFGGKGANQAVAAGRAGATIQFIGAVGDDSVGEQLRTQFIKDHIDIKSVSVIPGQKTGVALIYVNANGENEIGIYAGANAAVTPSYLHAYQQDIIAAQALLMQLETPLATIEAAAKLAKANHTQVILNPAPAQVLSDELLQHIDIITPNETEAYTLTGIKVDSDDSADQAAQILHQKGIAVVIITLGKRGAWVSQSGKGQLIPAFAVQAIDTIAAGDTFNGVLVTALLANEPLLHAVKIAHAASAIAVTRKGAQPSVPWQAEIAAFLQKQMSA